MASKNLETRETQKASYTKKREERIAALLEEGLSAAVIAKDPKIKHFKAKEKQISGAISRISFLGQQTAQLQEKKDQRKAEKEAKRVAEISGESKKKEKKKVEDKKPETAKKKAAAGKAPAQGKQQTKKK